MFTNNSISSSQEETFYELSILRSTEGMKVKGKNIRYTFFNTSQFTANKVSGEISWKVSAAVCRTEVKF